MNLAILTSGVACPLGIGARRAALALRAGRTGLCGAPFAGAQRDRVVAGVVPTVAWGSSSQKRRAQLAHLALSELLDATSFAQTRMAVLFAESLTAGEPAGPLVSSQLTTKLGERLVRFDSIVEGATSAGDLISRASGLLESRDADVVLWGGAHSDVAEDALRHLASTDRLYDADHLDAVMPGEAASFVALTTPGRAEPGAQAFLRGVGHGTTAAGPDNDLPVDGDAMTGAVRAAMTVPDADVQSRAGWVLSDIGYEMFRVREWEAVQVRAREHLGVPYQWDALPQRMGRIGAAHLPLSIALAAASFSVGHLPSSSALAIAGTDEGRRSALFITS